MIKHYAFIEKDGSIGIGSKSSRPDNAVCVVPDNLADKKIKLIDQPLLNPDGTEQTDIDGNVITEKVAVLDVEAQAAYEAEQVAAAQEELLKQQERDALVTKLKDSKGKVKAMKLEELTLVVEDILNYLGL